MISDHKLREDVLEELDFEPALMPIAIITTAAALIAFMSCAPWSEILEPKTF